jgi:hypothetical protein
MQLRPLSRQRGNEDVELGYLLGGALANVLYWLAGVLADASYIHSVL